MIFKLLLKNIKKFYIYANNNIKSFFKNCRSYCT